MRKIAADRNYKMAQTVADGLDAEGNDIDTDGDGAPDYLEGRLLQQGFNHHYTFTVKLHAKGSLDNVDVDYAAEQLVRHGPWPNTKIHHNEAPGTVKVTFSGATLTKK